MLTSVNKADLCVKIDLCIRIIKTWWNKIYLSLFQVLLICTCTKIPRISNTQKRISIVVTMTVLPKDPCMEVNTLRVTDSQHVSIYLVSSSLPCKKFIEYLFVF